MTRHSSGAWAHPPAKRTPFPAGRFAVWLVLVAAFLIVTLMIATYTPPAVADVPAACVSAGC